MPDRRLQFSIGAKDEASRVFQQVARNASDAMGDVEGAMDDGRSAGERLVDTLNADLDDLVATMRGTGEAADALGRALGPELTGKVDLTAAATKFQQLGLSVDEVKTHADDLADYLKRINDVSQSDSAAELDKVKQSAEDAKGAVKQLDDTSLSSLDGQIDSTRGKLEEDIPRSAGSANSAMANMIGNSSQDFGELLGVTGSLGVGIGQMGEYAADAALDGERLGSALGSMARVAGPIAALAAATKVVSDVMAARGEAAQVESGNIEQLTNAYKEGVDPARNYADALRDVGEVQVTLDRNATTSEQGGFFGFIGSISEKLGPLGGAIQIGADKLGLWGQATADLSPLLAEAGVQVDQWSQAVMGGNQAYGDMATALSHTTLSAEEQKTVLEGLATSQDQNAESKRNAEQIEGLFGDTVDRAAEALRNQQAQQESAAAAADYMAQRQAAMDQTAQKVNETIDAQRQAFQTYQQTVTGSDWGAASFDGAATAMSAYNDLLFAGANNAQENEDAFRTLSESIKENGDSFDVSTEQGGANQDALEGVARTLEDDLAAAYDNAKGNGDQFKASAEGIANSLRDRLKNELGLSDDKINEVITSLGLMPDQIETRYKLSGDEEARQKIGLLQGSIDALPKNVQAEVNQKVIAGDYQGALNTIQTYYNNNPATVKVNTVVGKVTGSSSLGTIGGMRAGGGPVNKGLPYIVGEDGPEVMVPDQSGTILPNGTPPPSSGTPLAVSAAAAPVVLNLNMTVNAGAGANGGAIAEELSRWARTNGRKELQSALTGR